VQAVSEKSVATAALSTRTYAYPDSAGLLYCPVAFHMYYEQSGKTPWQHLLALSAASVKVRVPLPFCVFVLHCCFIETGVQVEQ